MDNKYCYLLERCDCHFKQPYSIPHLWPRRKTKNIMQKAPDSSQGRHIYRAAVRLPHFWPDRPGLWFAQAEAQFALASVTSDKTKFNYVIYQLEYRHAAEVLDVIISPPADEAYTTLKTELVRHLSSSCDQHIRQLLTHEDMGDRKPYQFLLQLLTLSSPN